MSPVITIPVEYTIVLPEGYVGRHCIDCGSLWMIPEGRAPRKSEFRCPECAARYKGPYR